MDPISHPGGLLKRELDARRLSANRLAHDLGVPSRRITDILNGRRSITADRRYGLAVTLATALVSGWTCRASTTWLLGGRGLELAVVTPPSLRASRYARQSSVVVIVRFLAGGGRNRVGARGCRSSALERTRPLDLPVAAAD